MSEDSTAPGRPWAVAVAVVLLMVLVALGVAEGVLLLLTRYTAEVQDGGAVLEVSLAGAAGILLSLLLGAVVAGVWRGSRAARIVVTVAVGLALVLDAVTLSSSPTDLWWTVLDAAFYAFVILALWVGSRTAAFFRPPARRRGAAAAAV